MTALSKLDRFKPGTNFAAWMGTFVRFTALNQRRKQTRRAMRVVDGADPEAQGCEQATGASTALFDAEVTRALQSLGDVARTCLLLKTVIELDYREIAQVLDIPEGTAMSHVSRARSKMRQLLEDARATPTARSKEGA